MLHVLPQIRCPRNSAKNMFDKGSLSAVLKNYVSPVWSAWCRDHTNKFQKSPTHLGLGSLEMFRYVLSKHSRNQLC